MFSLLFFFPFASFLKAFYVRHALYYARAFKFASIKISFKIREIEGGVMNISVLNLFSLLKLKAPYSKETFMKYIES